MMLNFGIFDVLFILIVIMVIFIMFFYGILLNLLVRGKQLSRKHFLPRITVIIPAYNEEKYIERKVRNLLECYTKKKMTIIVVNNGSTDNTAKIAARLPVKLLESKPGKINALNKGLDNCNTEIVVMTDADTLLDKSCIKSLISCLHNNIAAACGSTVLRQKKLFYMISKNKYSNKDWALRYKEGLLDTPTSLDGKIIALRKSLFQKFPDDTYADDYELTFSLRKLGYRCVVDDNAKVYEEVPSNFKEEIKQIRKRMNQVIIMNFRKIRFLFNPSYGYFGMMIFPSRKFLPLLFPLFGFYILLYLFIFSWVVGLIFLLMLVILLFLFKQEYRIMQLLGVSLAWLDVLTFRVRKGSVWQKVTS